MVNFGENLSIELIYKKMNKTNLAKKVGVSVSTISKICKSQRRPSLEVASKIADALGVTVDYLSKGEGRKNAKRKTRLSRNDS